MPRPLARCTRVGATTREVLIGTHPTAARDTAFELAAGADPAALLDGLQALLPSRRAPPRQQRRVGLDTFDGRLTRAGATLWAITDGTGTTLCCQLPGEARERVVPAPAPPAFAADLPPGLREPLAPLLAMRRLLPLLEVQQCEDELDVLDDERKTVARLRLVQETVRRLPLPGAAAALAAPAPGETTLAAPQPQPARLCASPVRGYGAALQSLLPVLRSRPVLRELELGPAQLQREQLAAALPPRPPQPGAGLRADLPAGEALRRIQRALLDTLALQEAGVRLDLDSEFLHQYRVAVRRARCLLGQLKRVLPADDVARWLPELTWLGRLTGPVRDLDVLLLRLGATPLPDAAEAAETALAPVIAHAQRLQREEHARLVAQLDSPRYAALLAGWRTYLDAPPREEAGADRADQPVADVAAQRVGRLHRRLVRRGRALEPASPPEDFHALRIDAKKMRYVLDCTRSALDTEAAGTVVAALKQLQSVLGEAQDSHVQRGLLQRIARDLAAAGDVPAGTFLAIGQLDERLRAAGEHSHLRFAEAHAAFATDALRQTVRRLRTAASPPHLDAKKPRGTAPRKRSRRSGSTARARGAATAAGAKASDSAPATPAARRKRARSRPARQPRSEPRRNRGAP